MYMRHSVLLVAVCICCVGSVSTFEVRDESKTITIVGRHEDWLPGYEKCVNDYLATVPANETLRVEFRYVDKVATVESMPTLLNTELPDIVEWFPGVQMRELQEAGQLLNLSPYAEGPGGYLEALSPSFVATNSGGDGNLYSVQSEATGYAFFYNQNIFATLGLTVPSSYVELLTVMDALKAANKPFVMSKQGWHLGGLFHSLAATGLTEAEYGQYLAFELEYSGSTMMPIVKKYLEVIEHTDLSISNAKKFWDVADLFEAGEVGMILSPTWIMNEFKLNTTLNTTNVFFPPYHGTGGRVGGLMYGAALVVNQMIPDERKDHAANIALMLGGECMIKERLAAGLISMPVLHNQNITSRLSITAIALVESWDYQVLFPPQEWPKSATQALNKVITDVLKAPSNGTVADLVTYMDSYRLETWLGTALPGVFSPPTGVSGVGPLLVNISTETAGANIHYTVDGVLPSDVSPVYDGSISLLTPGEHVIRAIVLHDALKGSVRGEARYVVLEPPAAEQSSAVEGGLSTIVIVLIVAFAVTVCVLAIALIAVVLRRQPIISADEYEIHPDEVTKGPAIGQGAFGIVYRGEFRGTEVAIKELLSQELSKEARASFVQEVIMMCKLRHPNVVLFMGASTTPPHLMMVTELLEEGDLYTVLHDTDIPLSRVTRVRMLVECSRGMQYLHGAEPPIVHRDLKSPNLLLGQNFAVKVSDFGLTEVKNAKRSDSGGDGAGSLFWLPPESLDNNIFGTESDVYAYGIVMWEVLTRKHLYEGLNMHAVALLVIKDGLRPDPAEVSADFEDDEIEKLMESCWAADPERRPSFEGISTTLNTIHKHLHTGNMLNSSMDTNSSGKSAIAPTGQLAMVALRVDRGDEMWKTIPSEMENMIRGFERVVRTQAQRRRGYLGTRNGMNLLYCFQDPRAAVNFAMALQLRLLEYGWTQGVLDFCGATQTNVPRFRGPRVAMAIHAGSPRVVVDGMKTKYEGSMVGLAWSLCQLAEGGQVLITDAAHALAGSRLRSEDMHVASFGTCRYQEQETAVWSILPAKLSRSFSNTPAAETVCLDSFDDLDGTTVDSSAYLLGKIEDDRDTSIPFDNKDIEVGGLLGRGTFANTYHAYLRDSDGRKTVAVKRFLQNNLTNEQEVIFRQEIAMMSLFQHPYVVRFYGYTTRPHKQLVIELVTDGSVAEMIDQRPESITLERTLRLLVTIASGMTYLHASVPPIIHRDLKPGNILVTVDGDAKITDFGFSRLKNQMQTMTKCGTVFWTAPEILQGLRYNAMVDVYAYGILMANLAQKENIPYKNSSLVLASRIVNGTRPAIPKETLPALTTLMKKCWDGAPDARPSFSTIMARVGEIGEAEGLSHIADIGAFPQPEPPKVGQTEVVMYDGDELRWVD